MKLVCVLVFQGTRVIELINDEVKDYPLWVHVDAAWAGVLLSCPEYREQLQLARINAYADSFCTNFHKVGTCSAPSRPLLNSQQWGLVNFDASTLWVRSRKHLTDALDVTPEFLRTKQGDAGATYLAQLEATTDLALRYGDRLSELAPCPRAPFQVTESVVRSEELRSRGLQKASSQCEYLDQ